MPVWNMVMATQYSTSETSKIWKALFLKVFLADSIMFMVAGSALAYMCSSMV